MSATAELPAVADPYRPADLSAHEADKARRKAERDKRAPILDRCLDPAYASRLEQQKELFEWEVSAKFSRRVPDARGREEMKSLEFAEMVTAHSEAEAWAKFCDKIGHYPSRHKANVKFKRKEKIN